MEKEATATHILDASNRFYTLIPHDFGLQKPPLLADKDIIKAKTEMLDNLMEIEIAYGILKGDAKSESKENPIDVHYKKLCTDMEVCLCKKK